MSIMLLYRIFLRMGFEKGQQGLWFDLLESKGV
jgi:hypothetical protein